MGLVFQYPEYQLFEETVYKDISFGPKNMGLTEKEIDERVRQAAELVGLSDEILSKSPFDPVSYTHLRRVSEESSVTGENLERRNAGAETKSFIIV